ncbi:MAG: DUF1848 domain-containing protein [Planctomycetota bacterium]|nr:DUF1848 domain-containing protein [Planctomycetota bacterium]
MIGSVSRRTDIPAFYTDWFFNRLEEGWCEVPNPFNAKQISTVDLRPEAVDAFVFWTRDASPMLERLNEIDKRGYRYYFLYTLTPYGPPLEAHPVCFERRLGAFKELSRRIGPKRVIWRYDPVVFSNVTDLEYHKAHFRSLCESLQGWTNRCISSFVTMYAKTRRRLSALSESGIEVCRQQADHPQARELVTFMKAEAAERGIELRSCAQDEPFERCGIVRGKCVDDALLEELFGMSINVPRHRGQRASCRCVLSRDIGVNNTCTGGCSYCYSTRDFSRAMLLRSKHDPTSPRLA